VTPTEHFSGEVVPSPTGLEVSQGQIWIDSLMHDPDLMEYVIRKLGPGGADRIVLGSDYPFPLGEVPMAGKMLIEDDRLGRFMNWKDRAGILSRNAIRFLKLGQEFEDKFEKRLKQFEAARGLPADKQMREGGWESWRHRDSAIDLDGDEEVDGMDGKPRPVHSDADRSPRSISR
jgi:aminocarboxymuconate-semialdehyde decarboxylase